MCADSKGSGETARMSRAFAGRLCDKYQNLMSWLKQKLGCQHTGKEPFTWLTTCSVFGAVFDVSISFPLDVVTGVKDVIVSVPDHWPFTFTSGAAFCRLAISEVF